jgi:hypothetical protein
MKKILFTLLLVTVTTLLYSCASNDYFPNENEPSIYDDLTYDFETLTFTNTTAFDILYHVGNPSEDFIILHQELLNKTLTDTQKSVYQHLLINLEDLSKSTQQSLSTILKYSSSELNVALEQADITVTLDDIVAFNELKSFLDEIKLSSNQTLSISKTTYIELRLTLDLNQEDLNNLDFLQKQYIELIDYEPTFLIKENSFDDMILILENIANIYSDDEILSLEHAFQIIKNMT